MKCTTLFILCAVALCFSVYAAAAAVDTPRAGVWTATLRDDDPSTLQISIFQGKRQRTEWSGWNNIMGFDVPLADATGLAATDISAQAANVQFALVRPAGTIKFDGRFSEGSGAGNFR